MSESETKLADTTGKFTRVVKEGRQRSDARWQNGRLVLTTKRLVIASADSKETILLSDILSIRGRYDVNRKIATVTDYLAFDTGSDVVLVSVGDVEAFERKVQRAIVGGAVVLIKHPAEKGGAPQDSSWRKARVSIGADVVKLPTFSGKLVRIEIGDVVSVRRAERPVEGDERPVVTAEHAEDGTSVLTSVAGNARHCSILQSVLDRGVEKNATSIDLADRERDVLVAIYSGVPPLDVPEAIGVDPAEVEAIYDRLIDLDVVEAVQTRREVSMKPLGRFLTFRAVKER